MIRLFFFLLTFCSPLLGKASISFMAVDLKYNEKQGIKVCEMQPGCICNFRSSDIILGRPGATVSLAYDTLEKYHDDFVMIQYDALGVLPVKEAKKRNWTLFVDAEEAKKNKSFMNGIKKGPKNPNRFRDYSKILYGCPFGTLKFSSYPGAIVVDEPFFPYMCDKGKVSKLFTIDPNLERFRPQNGIFSRVYTPELADQILETVTSEKLVIKPVDSCKGRGVIILEREDLPKTIEYILTRPPELENDPRPEYRFWYNANSFTFLVEEAVFSDTVYHENRPYDPTMRVLFLVLFDGNNVKIEPFHSFWKLPVKSLEEGGSLCETHRSSSYLTVSIAVDPLVEAHIFDEVQEMMETIFPLL